MKSVSFFLILILSVSCANTLDIKSGDIVFRGALNSELSEAINEVTQTSKSTSYTHMGICDVEDGTVFVYHSDLGKGVVKEPLDSFIGAEDSVSQSVDLYRIKNMAPKQIEEVISKAKLLVGNPYNTTYILEDEGYYCSEYIYEIIKKDSVFELEPMTFKDAETNSFHKGWIEHYENLGIAIPEGKPGCNPNGMANSKTIEFIKNLN
ncbi:YiiX/YebB-like N1pC/P60 family cysteine hydrolase [Winogradskyella schleiferi]|uniref:YiiX/YebB-like N1pC/P60 family cysteine hydrolase n=1 Tax=Winogradskyella schleiferi TaxID=2686078 RepID=UPI0015C0A395|nr:YiiX/YebB-like N1pC/P60 family cysteine hydrolase [Winogradskyella schleiferi]